MKKTLLFKIIFFLLISLSVTNYCNAQINTGGTMGISYDDGYVIEFAPTAGYKYYKIFESGASPFFSYAEKYNKYAFGGRIYSQVTIYKETFAHAEFEVANVEVIQNNLKTREWQLALPIGGGYRYKISDGVYAYGMILYNVLQSADSHTKNPIIRGGITYQP